VRNPRRACAAAIEQEHHLLVTLVLVFARDQLAVARGRLPVDPGERVAVAVLAQLVEVETLAAPLALAHTEQAQAVVGREQHVVRDPGEIG